MRVELLVVRLLGVAGGGLLKLWLGVGGRRLRQRLLG